MRATEDRSLALADVKSLLELVQQVYQLPDSADLRAHHVLTGLRAMIDSSMASLSVVEVRLSDNSLRYLRTHFSGLENVKRVDVFKRYLADCVPQSPLHPPLVHLVRQPKFRGGCWQRRDLVGDQPWYGSTHMREIRQTLGMDDLLVSVVSLDSPNHHGVLAMNRVYGDPRRFTRRDADLLHLLHAQIACIYGSESAENETRKLHKLSARLRQTLDCLLSSGSEKQIAATMGLSSHTIHNYVKSLYRQLGISSRAELMARDSPRPDVNNPHGGWAPTHLVATKKIAPPTPADPRQSTARRKPPR